ncbi:hypothetical protein [Enterobacter pseudoroggenkampii]|uniref:hypothetical protein n=1 Tax=Enterobacter pseudoroggenkampii TaxID=2996112 RepID=UPI0022642AAB|nr:hypothetical protein [Enterobacter pseudoroggenkampii]MCX8289092.1 hypothetical protein [Enterobacter pseudoroggenkampii]
MKTIIVVIAAALLLAGCSTSPSTLSNEALCSKYGKNLSKGDEGALNAYWKEIDSRRLNLDDCSFLATLAYYYNVEAIDS